MPSPGTLVHAARPGHSVIGWKLEPAQREALLGRIEPAYPVVVADHVTLASGVAGDTPPPDEVAARAVGRIDDGRGVEALVVEIGGTTDRPGGGTYHVTWSLGHGRAAKESNEALAEGAWRPLREPIDLRLVPARLR